MVGYPSDSLASCRLLGPLTLCIHSATRR